MVVKKKRSFQNRRGTPSRSTSAAAAAAATTAATTTKSCSLHVTLLWTVGLAVGFLGFVNYGALSAIDKSVIVAGSVSSPTTTTTTTTTTNNNNTTTTSPRQLQQTLVRQAEEQIKKAKQQLQQAKEHRNEQQQEKPPSVEEDSPAEDTYHSLQYYLALSQKEGHDKERLLHLLQNNARLEEISEATYQKLPTWAQITFQYGTEARLVGYQEGHCRAFQADGLLGEKFMAPSGSFNSGTNLLADALVKNCVLPEREAKYKNMKENKNKLQGVRWQVPWGKHNPPQDQHFRANFHAPGGYSNMDPVQTLPIVMIRDPFRWMQSMCHNSYTGRWARLFRPEHRHYHCPNLWPTQAEWDQLKARHYLPILKEGMSFPKEIPGIHPAEAHFDNKVKPKPKLGAMVNLVSADQSPSDVDYIIPPTTNPLTPEQLKLHHFPVHVMYGNKQLNFTRFHASLIHLWNDWYGEYYHLAPSELPRLITRMEDLLFFPDQVVPKMCECAGGQLRNSINATGGGSGVQIPVASTKSTGHNSLATVKGQREQQTGYVDALIKYGNPTTRFLGHSPHDLQYAAHYLDREMMEAFGYQYPATTAK